MKILHTSDLHLGHSFYHYDRAFEQESCLRQIETVISKDKPDAYLISGDVYHNSSPQGTAQQMFLEHILRVHEIAPEMKIVVTAGNHDSSRMEILAPLWNLAGVSVIASVKRNILEGEDKPAFHEELFRRHIIPVEKEGKTTGFIVALPHCYPANYPSVKPDLPRDLRQREFISLLLNKVAELNNKGVPVVIMAHTAVRRPGGKSPEAKGQDLDIIGGIDMVRVEDFSTGYDYVALGHIHYPQNITPRIRYCGSPLPVSFDEDFPHSISLVSIPEHGALPKVETVEIANPLPVVTIPEHRGLGIPEAEDRKPDEDLEVPEAEVLKAEADLGAAGTEDRGLSRADLDALSWEEAKAEFEAMSRERECYVRLNVYDDGTIPAEAKEIAAKIPGRFSLKARFCLINRVRKAGESIRSESGGIELSTAQLAKMTPYSLAELYLRDTGTSGLDPQILAMLRETVKEVENEVQTA